MTSAKSRAVDALVDDDYELAIELFTEAIKEAADVDVFVGRAAAYIKLENFVSAVNDAKRAIELDPQNHRGYFKKGEAAFQLEEYETAQAAFQQALETGASAAKCNLWIRKCKAELAEEEVEEIKPVPSRSYGVPPQATPKASTSTVTNSAASEAANTPKGEAKKEAEPAKAETTGPSSSSEPGGPKYRHQFFQTQNVVEVAVLAKNLTADRVKLSFEEQSLSVVILDQGGIEEYNLYINLFGSIKPSESKFELLKTKVEIQLRKAQPIHWPSLESGSGKTTAIPAAAPSGSQPQAPAYPSSFKRRAVDWDKLEADLKKEEKDEKLDGDAALQKLFQGIYAGADEDTRRAMNKSFQESNGTVLSTNWQEIGSKKTEFKPHDGGDAEKA